MNKWTDKQKLPWLKVHLTRRAQWGYKQLPGASQACRLREGHQGTARMLRTKKQVSPVRGRVPHACEEQVRRMGRFGEDLSLSRSSIPHLEYGRTTAAGPTAVSGTDRQSPGCLCSETAPLYHSRGCGECYPGAGVLPAPKTACSTGGGSLEHVSKNSPAQFCLKEQIC